MSLPLDGIPLGHQLKMTPCPGHLVFWGRKEPHLRHYAQNSPLDQRFDSRMSDNSIFYTYERTEGSIICLDDTCLSDAI